ncbi:MAG: DUF3846 domain-containing protein [Oscillospiraceae bacterium]|nr:DUF3846 domain-containing protein [Oscillospiraceae bacterium]
MQVVTKEPGKLPEIRELHNDQFREFLGGCMETVPYGDGYIIVCNDAFLVDDSPFNCCIGNTMFFGNIFICGESVVNDLGEHDLVGLTDDQIESEFFQFLIGNLIDSVH